MVWVRVLTGGFGSGRDDDIDPPGPKSVASKILPSHRVGSPRHARYRGNKRARIVRDIAQTPGDRRDSAAQL